MRFALAVIAGFILWSVLWLCYNVVLRKAGMLPPEETQRLESVPALLMLLVGSAVVSLLAGYIASLVYGSASYGPIIMLGVLLLAVGAYFQSQYWHLMPLWYHLSFLVLLIPLCLFGASLRSR